MRFVLSYGRPTGQLYGCRAGENIYYVVRGPTDLRGVNIGLGRYPEHTVEMTSATLYGAVAAALAALRDDDASRCLAGSFSAPSTARPQTPIP